MGKPKTEPKFGPNQAGATAKFVRCPPRKARLVMDAVRGRYVTDALALLKFVPNRAARLIEKVIESAAANAENGRPLSEETGRPLPPLARENLRVVRCYVNEGPRMKRIQPRAQGRAFRILKRFSHLTVIVEEVAPKPRPVRRAGAARRAAAAGRPAAVEPAKPAAGTTAPGTEAATATRKRAARPPKAAATPAAAPAVEETASAVAQDVQETAAVQAPEAPEAQAVPEAIETPSSEASPASKAEETEAKE